MPRLIDGRDQDKLEEPFFDDVAAMGPSGYISSAISRAVEGRAMPLSPGGQRAGIKAPDVATGTICGKARAVKLRRAGHPATEPALEAIGTLRHQDAERSRSVDDTTAALSAGAATLLLHMPLSTRIAPRNAHRKDHTNPARFPSSHLALPSPDPTCHESRWQHLWPTWTARDSSISRTRHRSSSASTTRRIHRSSAPAVTMFDGISTLPSKVAIYEEYSLRDDEERRVWIDRLIAAIEAYLTSVGDRVDIPFYDDLIFGDTDGAQSSTLRVAWAGAFAAPLGSTRRCSAAYRSR
ncbi:hypothetical protein GGTG_12151 [Gaeumannomyces tritici R3-111a-1]|uniref:Uncharacterized protein n=1 Tax=Gaeumannomyces tritici (strain R3-111a-1) TaxID=644352 RepID=J3PF72_GAET3|nr:hypothetical protein GGTG_12151 [Gaeumannomyces tritici R3-111a-1]EJT69974.1 hypothetical protein GGTG_12151 [Gaeumannomyces tritici R3-111a-1]